MTYSSAGTSASSMTSHARLTALRSTAGGVPGLMVGSSSGRNTLGMIMQYVRIRRDEFDTLRRLLVEDANGAFDFVDALADGSADDVPARESRSLDTDRAWAAISYLLDQSGPRAVDVVHGGARLTEDEWG